jgi:hypothetical protein
VNSDDCDPQKQNQRISSLESEVKQLKDKVAELERITYRRFPAGVASPASCRLSALDRSVSPNY